MTHINPYRKNCELLQKFFAKPITLIIAILLCCCVLANCVYDFLAGNGISPDLATLLPIIGFFTLYFSARKANGKPMKAPITILTVNTLLGIVSCGIFFLVILISGLLLLLSSFASFNETVMAYIEFASNIGALVIMVVVPLLLIDLLFNISFLITLNSFKKSASSVFLHKNGAIFLGVMSIIMFAFGIIISFLEAPITQSITNLSPQYLGDTSALVDSSVLFSLSVVTGTMESIVYILYAVFAFSYNKYITGICNKITVEKPVIRYSQPTPDKSKAQVTQPQNENGFSPVSMWESTYKTNPNQKPQEPEYTHPGVIFTPPQPAPFNPTPAFNPQQESVNNENANPNAPIPPYQNFTPQNPYLGKK